MPVAIFLLYCSTLVSNNIYAQEVRSTITITTEDKTDNDYKMTESHIVITDDDVVVVNNDKDNLNQDKVIHINADPNAIFNNNKPGKKKKSFKLNLLTMDLGINGFVDNTDYTSSELKDFVRIDDEHRNGTAFKLKNGQSRNFNLWPATFNFDLSSHPKQNVYLSVGVPGFQFYSLKYNNSIHFVEGMDPHVVVTEDNYTKNKLGVTYLSIPVSITGQTKVSKSKWLTYGAGIIGGYRIASWTNQKINGVGRTKVKDPYNLNDYQVALTGELGVKGVLRLYATYNLTNMWDSGLDQNLFAVGIRFFGI